MNIDCQTRFSPFIQKYVHKLAEWSQIPALSHAAVMAQWDWAWMNLCTRCFGHYHVPNDLAMVPLMDMINHAPYQTKLQFFLKPHKLNAMMLEIDVDKNTNQEMMVDLYNESLGFVQKSELDSECLDSNQHTDDYPDKYYNYEPEQIL